MRDRPFDASALFLVAAVLLLLASACGHDSPFVPFRIHGNGGGVEEPLPDPDRWLAGHWSGGPPPLTEPRNWNWSWGGYPTLWFWKSGVVQVAGDLFPAQCPPVKVAQRYPFPPIRWQGLVVAVYRGTWTSLADTLRGTLVGCDLPDSLGTAGGDFTAVYADSDSTIYGQSRLFLAMPCGVDTLWEFWQARRCNEEVQAQ